MRGEERTVDTEEKRLIENEEHWRSPTKNVQISAKVQNIVQINVRQLAKTWKIEARNEKEGGIIINGTEYSATATSDQKINKKQYTDSE